MQTTTQIRRPARLLLALAAALAVAVALHLGARTAHQEEHQHDARQDGQPLPACTRWGPPCASAY